MAALQKSAAAAAQISKEGRRRTEMISSPRVWWPATSCGLARTFLISGPQHIQQPADRLEVFQPRDGADDLLDLRCGQPPLGVDPEFFFDLGARQRILGRTLGMLAAYGDGFT